jgi:hypothetical protein
MTAYELADLIGMCGDGGYNQDAAAMLRQLQAENDALKEALSKVVTISDRKHDAWDKAKELLEAKRMVAYNIGYEDGKKEQQK